MSLRRRAGCDLRVHQELYIVESMGKQILVELDAETAARLERAAPASSRTRSEFIRAAIRRALWELEERETRAAYLGEVDGKDPAWPEPEWEPWTASESKAKPKVKAKKR